MGNDHSHPPRHCDTLLPFCALAFESLFIFQGADKFESFLVYIYMRRKKLDISNNK